MQEQPKGALAEHVKRVGGQQFEPTSGAAQVGNASNPQRQTPTERPPGEAPRECVLWEDVLGTLEGRAAVTSAESCSYTEESLESARCMRLVDDRVEAEPFHGGARKGVDGRCVRDSCSGLRGRPLSK